VVILFYLLQLYINLKKICTSSNKHNLDEVTDASVKYDLFIQYCILLFETQVDFKHITRILLNLRFCSHKNESLKAIEEGNLKEV
jgi:hypothetical protein